MIAAKESESYTILDLTDTPSQGFTFTERTVTVEFDSKVDAVSDFALEYTGGGKTCYTDDLGIAPIIK